MERKPLVNGNPNNCSENLANEERNWDMKNVLLHVLPQFLVPAAFAYCLWGSRYAEGWGGLVLGACLGFIVPFSGIAGAAVAGLALFQRWRNRKNWRWLLVSAGIVGSPAVVALLHLVFKQF